jgi:hypothetical protein
MVRHLIAKKAARFLAKEEDIAIMADLPIERIRWWSPRWMWWFLAMPKPPSLYAKGEAAPDTETWRLQLDRWLEREPK